MAKNKDPKYKGHENPELHRSIIGRALSSAAGVHNDKREKRARTRAAAKNRAINDDK